jgi:hypothetical protein
VRGHALVAALTDLWRSREGHAHEAPVVARVLGDPRTFPIERVEHRDGATVVVLGRPGARP